MRRRDQGTVCFLNPPDLQHIHVVYGKNMGNEFPRHVHNGFCVGIVQKGARIVCQGGSSTIIPENALFVINPGVAHTCKSQDKEHSYFIICVEAESMKAIASQISKKTHTVPYFKNIPLYDKALGSKIRQFFSLIENTSSALERESVLFSLLSELVLHYGEESPIPCRAGVHDGALKRACEFIRTYYAQDLSLRQLSSVACLSPFYFQRLFLENTGVSPHDYLLQIRIRKAQELLLYGKSIACVAVDTGFVDQSHFTRSFKRVTGTTPGSYFHNTGKHKGIRSV
jgi:AraC-like DNA-binding protein